MESSAVGAKGVLGSAIKIFFRAHGEVKKYFPAGQYHVTLSQGATLREFYLALQGEEEAAMPDSIWLREEKKFASSVIVTVDGKITNDVSYLLKDGQVVGAYRIVIGG